MSHTIQDPQRRHLLQQLMRLTGALAITATAPRPAAAGTPTVVRRISLRREAGLTRVTFDLSSSSQPHLFTLAHPDRVVIDFADTRTATPLRLPVCPLIRRVRHVPRGVGNLRMVLDLSAPVRVHSRLLPPSDRHGSFRWEVDLALTSPLAAAHNAPVTDHRLRDILVAIDPGHGGKDPGAIGGSGTYEKYVVLAIAKRLAQQISHRAGMRPLLTRDGDYFVSLRGRVKKARAHRADLFISVHADASPYHYAKGSTVYVLSEHGASSEAARLLAQGQNQADRIGGISLSDKDRELASVLVDLEQEATYGSSMTLGYALTDSIAEVVALHSREVERAPFAVLKSPDIPSVLVETAFISNPAQEQRLRSPHFQREMADALMNGVDAYFRHHAPPGTWLAAHHAAG